MVNLFKILLSLPTRKLTLKLLPLIQLTTGDYTMTLIETAPNIPATNVAFDETRLFTLDGTQKWTQSMISEVNDGLHKWENVITATPTGTKISPTFSLQSFTDK